MTTDLILHGERVELRPLTAADVDALVDILREPAVERWWGTYSYRDDPRGHFSDGESTKFSIFVDGDVAGMIQYHEEDDPDYRSASIDIFVSTAQQGRGIGPDALRALAAYLIDVRGHHRITIDPRADNENAIRAYEKVGFRRVGVVRAYERHPDGVWHDALLMDMLARELVRP